MPPKSVFRQPGAQHFQLVHRSLRDPLADDPDASQRVLKPVGRPNERKSGTTLADLEATERNAARPNEGEAALYGITYDDSSYDYMAHLKPVGTSGAIESVLIAGPRGSAVASGMKSQGKGKGKAKAEDLLNLLPDGVLASKEERSQEEVWAKQEAIPPELQGLQPDMDPHLRQVLEALDDDAFVDDEGDEEGWFDELVKGGEAQDGDREEFEFAEWGLDGQGELKPETSSKPAAEETWEDRYKAFKQASREAGSDEEVESEMADTVGSLASKLGDLMVIGGKKRRGKRGPSDASGMSMSSSSMFRNEGLRTLDERFDKIERDYDIEDDEDEYADFPDDMSIASSMVSTSSRMSLFSNATSVAPPEVSREDFDAILDDFLENYEVVGRHMRQSLGTTRLSGTEKLKVLRDAVEAEEDGIGKEENRRRILEIERLGRSGLRRKEEREKLPMRDVVGKGDEDKWDAETIITTYTNTENHPGMIRSRRPADIQRAAKRRAQRALAELTQPSGSVPPPNGAVPDEAQEESEGDSSGSETETEARQTIARPKGESTEDRKARKNAVKAERAARRVEKRNHQKTFADERKRQLANHKKMVGGGKAADLTVARGVVSLS